jgi:broad specificity phosphatase PhoE
MTDARAAPRRIFLVRHGETAWSLTGQHTGSIDLALTTAGEEQARELAPALGHIGFSMVLKSQRRRARKTCALAGFGGLVARWIGLDAIDGKDLALDPASISTAGFEENDPSRPVISSWHATPSTMGGIRPSSSIPC